MKSCDSVFEGPLFVVGMPRSGTKLLRGLLNQHSEVAIPFAETEFLPHLVHRQSQFGDISNPENFHALYEYMQRLPFFYYLRRGGIQVEEASWRAMCVRHDIAGAFEGLVRTLVDAPYGSGVVWGDKSPSYIRHLPLLKTLYPSARFIHITRDVRDYCLSIHKAWGKNMYRAAERWSDGIVGAQEAGRLMGDDYLELRYEDLIGEPSTVMTRICAFIGKQFEGAMRQLPSGEVQSGNSGKYRSQMPARVCKKVEALAFQGMAACGYSADFATESVRSTPIQKRLWRLSDGVNLVRSNIQRHGLLKGALFQWHYSRQTRE